MLQKVDPGLNHLPVMPADRRRPHRREGARVETAGAIRKPIDLDELLSTIERFNKTAA